MAAYNAEGLNKETAGWAIASVSGFPMNIDTPEPGQILESRQENPDIETPPDSIPVPPDEEHGPLVETPPDRPGTPDSQPDPPPIKEPNPDEPTRLFRGAGRSPTIAL